MRLILEGKLNSNLQSIRRELYGESQQIKHNPIKFSFQMDTWLVITTIIEHKRLTQHS